jgi:hypothetical protein
MATRRENPHTSVNHLTEGTKPKDRFLSSLLVTYLRCSGNDPKRRGTPWGARHLIQITSGGFPPAVEISRLQRGADPPMNDTVP